MVLETNEIGLKTATFKLKPKGYLHIKYKEEEVGLKEAKQHEEACCKLANGIPLPFLIDARGVSINITSEAKKHLSKSKKLQAIRVAQAMLVDNLASRIIANFFIKTNKPNNPTKVFINGVKAVEWLLSYRN